MIAYRPLLAVVSAALLAAVAGCAPARPPAPPPEPTIDASRSPTPVATWRGPYASGPVAAPARGAYLGAWIKPARLHQPGRLAAVHGYEAALGRRLDIAHTYRKFEEDFGTTSDRAFGHGGRTVMVSWASGDTRSIVAGHHDVLIRAQAQRVRAVRRPVLLRFRWEMDRPNLRATMWSAADFIDAWRHVRRLFAEEGVRNASWVWCPTAEGFARGEAPDFYPGDADVDWVCVDVYAGTRFQPLGDLLAPFLSWAAARPKPIIVGEFGVARAWGPARRADWLRDAARVFKANPQIKAVCYFESDPDGNPPHQQFRLAHDRAAFEAFRELTRDPYFNPRGAARSGPPAPTPGPRGPGPGADPAAAPRRSAAPPGEGGPGE
ncbi:MAG TPA: glycosyl hydrolase [Pilimelia sp.]|nr:glycosyl hydrolase [Pilimelia sp.]